MALKPGTKAYEDWRKKNFNLNIKVPQSAIDKLMKGGTPSANIKKYAGTDNKVMREAMNRFYGKGWEKKAPGSTPGDSKPKSPMTPPRNVPPSVADGAKPKYGTNTPSARAAEGSKGYKAPGKAAMAKKAQGTLNKNMRSSDYRPTTSIGSFNPNAKVSKKDFSFNKLTPAQKEQVNATLGLLLLPGVGGLAVKGGMAATKALRVANVGRIAGRADKLVKAGKNVKAAKAGQKAVDKTKKLVKNPTPQQAKDIAKMQKGVDKLNKAPKAPKAAPKTVKSAPKTKPKDIAKVNPNLKNTKKPRGYNDVRKAMSDSAKRRGGKK